MTSYSSLSLSDEELRRRLLEHDVQCRIHTNSYGCSDYVCGLKEDRCDFCKPVKKVAPRSCPNHPLYAVAYELRVRNAAGQKRMYYRCNRPREESGRWWCGYEELVESNGANAAKSSTIGQPQVAALVRNDKGTTLDSDINVLQQKLERTRATIANIKLSALPDGGMKMIAGMLELESTLSKLKLESDTVRPMTANPPVTKQTVACAAWLPAQSTFYGAGETTDSRRELLTLAIERIHSSMATKPKETNETADPQHLTVPLMPHQRTALSWLLWRESQHPSGGILADDMGLGKTLTMIALILKSRELKAAGDGNDKREAAESKTRKDEVKSVPSSATLVVCPATLMNHWEVEVAKRCGAARLKVQLFHGTGRRSLTVSRLVDCDIIVTTYDTMRCELTNSKSASSSSVLQRMKFERIIFDEGHVIRNPKSNTSLSACTLKANSRWIITGTPIHNNLTDMYSLLRFLRCSPFDEYKVWKYWVDNRTPQGRERLATIVGCILLRRTKSDLGRDRKPLVSLPSKTVHNVALHLGKEEFEVYQLIFDQSKAMLENYLKTKSGEDVTSNPVVEPVRSKTGPQLINKGGIDNVGQQGMLQMLVQLLRLRQCCCHLSLLSEVLEVKGGVAANDEDVDPFDGITAQMGGLNLQEDGLKNVLVDVKSGKLGAAFARSYRSTKIGALLNKLKVLQGQPAKVKSVVVSQWTSMLDIVALHLKEAGVTFCRITGQVSITDRSQAVENFNGTSPNGPSIMLLSLKAGGVGLNLIGGSHLFFLDLHWNPALESQAADRVHRMGQLKDVHIYRFICEDTIETKIATLQKSKLVLAESIVQGESTTKKSQLSLQDLKQLFGMN